MSKVGLRATLAPDLRPWRHKNYKEQIFTCTSYFALEYFVNNPLSVSSTLGFRYKHHHSTLQVIE